MDLKKHIQSIIDDILESKEVSGIFIKLQVLVHLLKNERLTDWFKSEQYGYKDILLPDYRVFKVTVHGSLEQFRGFAGSLLYNNMELPISHINDEEILELLTTYQCREPLKKIEGFLQSRDTIFRLSVPSSCIGLLQRGLESNCHINQVWQEVQRADLSNIIEQVKSTLLEFLLEINDSLDLGIELDSTINKKEVERAINNTIYATNVTLGDNSSVHANNSTNIGGKDNTITLDSDLRKGIEEIMLQINRAIQDLTDEKEDILNELTRIKSQLAKTNPKISILSSALQTINDILVGVAGNVATPPIILGINSLLKVMGL